MTICLPTPGPRAVAPRVDSGKSWTGHFKVAPSGDLDRWIEHYWMTGWDLGAAPPRIASAMLPPAVHLQIGRASDELLGVVRGRHRERLTGADYRIGVRFRPGAFYPFALKPVSQWTGRRVRLADAFPRLATDQAIANLRVEVEDAGRDGDTLRAVVARHLDRWMNDSIRTADPMAERIAGLCERAADGRFQYAEELASELGCSLRTLYRLFDRYVGVSPAWLLRRYRIHAAANQLKESPERGLSAIALEFGYADQSHLTRDFREHLGVTPAAFAALLRTTAPPAAR